MKRKLITIISDTDHALAFEWCAERLNPALFTQQFIFLNPYKSPLETKISSLGFKTTWIKVNGKKDLVTSFFKVFRIIVKERPQIVHTHLFSATLIGLLASKIAGVKNRIYTRHHSNSNQTYAPKAVKYDLFINRLATKIIAISKNVADQLIQTESVPSEKVVIIYHGLNFQDILSVNEEKIIGIKKKYALTEKFPVIGVISRYIHLKGIQYIIPAFQKLLVNYPSAMLVLANAKGNYSKEIKSLLAEIPTKNYIEIGFETDLFSLYHTFDVYIHTPIDKKCEAFGQTYIESLACEIPGIFTLSGIATEFILDRKNALVVKYMDSETIYQALQEYLTDPTLKKNIQEQGKKDVMRLFDINQTVRNLELLYLT